MNNDAVSSQRDLKLTYRDQSEQPSIFQPQNQSKVTFVSKQLDSLNDIQPDFDDDDFPKNSKKHVINKFKKKSNLGDESEVSSQNQNKSYSKSEREINNQLLNQKPNYKQFVNGGSPQIIKKVTYNINQPSSVYQNQKSSSSGSNGQNNQANNGYKNQISIQSRSSTDRQISRRSFFGHKGFESSQNVNGKKKKVKIFGPFDQKQWKDLKKVVLIFTFVVSFISKITFKTKGKIALRNLNIQQVTAIGDNSYLYLRGEHYDGQQIPQEYKQSVTILDDDQFNQKLDFFLLRCIIYIGTKLSKCIPMIYPNGYFKILTDCWSSYWVAMFFTSIRLFYFITNIEGSIHIIKLYTVIIINLSFFIDMLLSLNTAYYENGIIVRNRKKIAYNYFKTTFLSDIISQIPLFFSYFVNVNSSRPLILISFVLEFLIFLKIFSLKKTFQRLERVITETETGAQWWPMVRLIVNVFLLAHIVGLLYFGLAKIQIDIFGEKNTWLQLQELEDESWFIQYLWSIYWAFGTMVANISRDPETQSEIIFSLIMIVVMTGTFGYVLNTIGMILSDIERNTKKYTLEKQMINRFMRTHQIPEVLRERVDLYLEQLQQLEKQRNQQEEELILARMSEQLKREILQSVNQKNIKKFQKLLGNFSEVSKLEFLLVIKEELYSPGDIIFKQNDDNIQNERIKDDLSLYYVQNGTVDIYYENGNQKKKSIVGKLKQGQIFGEIEFLSGKQRQVSAKANTSASVLKIDRTDFFNIVQNNPEDFQQLCMMCDQIQQYSTCQDYEIQCYLCQQVGHLPSECPTIHLNINVKQLIYDYNHYDIQINRASFDRIDVQSHHALVDMEFIIEAVNVILDESIHDDELKKKIQELQHNQESDKEQSNNANSQDIKNNRRGSFDQSLENYHNLLKLQKNSFVELQDIDEQQELSEDQQSSQASGLKVPQNQNIIKSTSPRASSSSQLHDIHNTTPEHNHLLPNLIQTYQQHSEELNLNQTTQNTSQIPVIKRNSQKRNSNSKNDKDQINIQINQQKRRSSQRGDFLRDSFQQQKSASKNFLERKIQQSQQMDNFWLKGNHSFLNPNQLNSYLKQSNQQSLNVSQMDNKKMQNSQNIKQTYDIDLFDSFDKMHNFIKYWKMFNYEQIMKEENVSQYFKNPNEIEEESQADSDSMHSSFFKSHCQNQQTTTTRTFSKQQNFSSKMKLNYNENQTDFIPQDMGHSMASIDQSQNLSKQISLNISPLKNAALKQNKNYNKKRVSDNLHNIKRKSIEQKKNQTMVKKYNNNQNNTKQN